MQNGLVERFNGRPRDEYLNEQVFASLAEARALIEAWRIDDNTIRPHGRLGGCRRRSIMRRGSIHPPGNGRIIAPGANEERTLHSNG